jgi:hypothetical protein
VPTYEVTHRFQRGYADLTIEQRMAFKRALTHFIDDTDHGTYRGSLRVKGVRGMPGCFEMTWAGDGRAVFTYGPEIRAGERHVIWLAVGTHAVLP